MPLAQNLARLISPSPKEEFRIASPTFDSLTSSSGSPSSTPLARRIESVLLHLCVCAVLLPVAAQATLGFLAVMFFLLRRGVPRLASAWSSSGETLLHRYWRSFALGLVLVWILLGLGPFAEFARLGLDAPGLEAAVMQHMRLLGKWGVYGICIALAFLFAALHKAREGPPLIRVRYLLGFALLYTLYMLGQRYYGWNWVHGWDARLGENRFAYGVYRGSGFMGHPLTLAYNALIFSGLTFGHSLWLWSSRRREAYAWLGLTACLIAILVLSGSRFPIGIACVLLSGGLLLHVLRNSGQRLRILWLIPLTLVLSVLGFLLLTLIDPSLSGRFAELSQQSQTREYSFDRLVFWQIHWSIFLDHPWFGSGFSQYDTVLLDAYYRSGFALLERKYNAHNIYLQTLAELGLLGMLALLVFIGNFLRLAWRFWSSWRHMGWLLLVLGLVSGGLLQNVLRDSEFLFACWFSLGLCLSWLIEDGKDRTNPLLTQG